MRNGIVAGFLVGHLIVIDFEHSGAAFAEPWLIGFEDSKRSSRRTFQLRPHH
jgi:hypothetical protein